MELSGLKKIRTTIHSKSKKRIGRGYGSGVGGHTSTRGSKGQKSRTGGNIPYWFEGGQLPLRKRLPHTRGFKPVTRKEYTILDLADIKSLDKENIDLADLIKQGLVRDVKYGVKVLGTGKLDKKVNLTGFEYTKSAKEKIEKAGGTAK